MKPTALKNKALFTKFVIFLIMFFMGLRAYGTHIVGATINYEYVSGNKYRVSVKLYRDCRTSNPPIPVPAPKTVRVNVRRSDNTTFQLTIDSVTVRVLPVPLPDDPCAQPPNVAVCVEEYTYSRVFDRFPAGFDYYLFFSLCCRNSTITNLAPEQQTETIYTKIPDRNIIPNAANATFKNPPPSYVCGGKEVTVPHEALDPVNGDRLVYSLYTPNAGPSRQIENNTYIPTVTNGFPNFVPVTYSTVNGVKFSGKSPMNANEKIDSTTGDLTFTANIYGQFVVGVKVKEYRGNTLISETLRDYQFNIVRCPPPAKAVLALSDICNSLRITPSNAGFDYPETSFLWKFGEASKAPRDTSRRRNPSYTYSQAGNYTIKLVLNPGTKCADSATRTIKVSQLKADFASTRDTCAGFPVTFTDKSTSSKNTTITSRSWNFSDGTPVSNATNPTHIFAAGGNYNIRYVITNSIGCKDSVVNVVKIIQEKPDAVAGLNDTLCKNNPTAQLKGVVSSAGGGIWKGGAGVFNPDRTTLNAKYTPTQDEIRAGSVGLKLVTTLNGKCGSDSAEIKLLFTDPPAVSPALLPYAPICGNSPSLDLGGSVLPQNRGFGIKWSGSGGTFTSNEPGDPTTNPFAKYELSAAELAAGRVTLNIESTNNGKCLPDKASTTVTISPPPVIRAGNDTTVCVNASSVNLRGTVNVPSKIIWTTNGGDGQFSGGNTSLKTVYNPGPNDKQKGVVEVYLSTNETPGATYPQNCRVVRDTMFIKILPAAVVEAGSDKSVCSNNPAVSISGSVSAQTGTGKGVWSGGKGTVLPDRKSLNITYTATAEEIAARSLKLYLTSDNNDKCLTVTDSVTINFTPSPAVDPGTGSSYCDNNAVIQLDGKVTGGASAGVWRGGKGKFTPDSTSLNATYTPTNAEVKAGSVKLTLRSSNNNNCLPVSRDITFNFTPAPKIEAGNPVSVCDNDARAQLNATVSPASFGIRWSGGKGTFSPSDTSPNAVYTLSADEIAAGKAVLTATTKNNGRCAAVSDQMNISIIRAPAIVHDTLASTCANNPRIKLSGSSVVGSGVWTSSTGGTFLPRDNDLNATYIPSETDIRNGVVTLSLLSRNSGTCGGLAGTFTAFITPPPVVNAGPSQTLCANNPVIQLAGTVNGGATTGIWSGGSNNFPGGSTNLLGTYLPTPQEIAAGKVLLTLTSTGNTNNTCSSVSDTVTYYFTPAPSVNPGGDITVCGDLSPVKLTGTATGQVTAVLWTTDGTGKFSTDRNMSTFYTPSQADQDRNSVKITFRSTEQGNCKPVEKSLNIIFTTKPSVNAGPDLNYCTTESSLQLNASGSPGTWTSAGGGSFVPSASVANAEYIPSATELSARSFSLVYTSAVTGPCPAVNDRVDVKVVDGPKTDLTAPSAICSDQLINLSAPKVSGVRVRWSSTGSGTFVQGDTAHVTTYKPSQTEIKNGIANFTLQVISPLCGSATKSFSVAIAPKFEVTAGGNQKICSDIKSLSLSGTKSGNFPTIWSTNGTGTFVSDQSLKTEYVPSEADLKSTGFNITLRSNGTECPNNSSTLSVSVVQAPKVEAGSDQVICNDTAGVNLNGQLGNAQATGGFWTTNGGGVISPNGLSARYSPKTGENGTFKFYLTTTGTKDCPEVRDSLSITINERPTVDAAGGGKVCADTDTIRLTSVFVNAVSVTWTKVQGTGTILNPDNASGSYLVTAADRANGFVTFRVTTVQGSDKCRPVSDQVVYDIAPATVISAGGDVEYCANTDAIPLTATVTNQASVLWTTTGTGTFTNPNSLTTNYKPSAEDGAKGSVDIIATALPTNICKAKRDTVRIKLTPVPVVTVPADFDVCADSSFIILEGTSSTGSGVWTSNGGNDFSPNAFTPSVRYIPNASDISKGKVTFTFTSKGNVSCAPVSKNVTVTITPAPKVDAGADQQVCADIAFVTLNATVTGAGGVTWTTSGSGKFNSTSNASGNSITDGYVLSSLDTLAKQITLTATTTGNGKCKAVSDKVVVRATSAPFIDAGPKSVAQCGDKTSIDLAGIFGHARNGKWTTSGTGKFAPNDTTKTASYLITSDDSLNGGVRIFYTTLGVGKCKTYQDTLNLTITPAPKVRVSDDRIVCADKDTIHLSGTKVVAGGVLWSRVGTGGASFKNDTTNIIYRLSQEDKKKGSVKFIMTSTGNGLCKAVSDSLTVSITPAPTASAGMDQTLCSTVNAVDLSGSLGNTLNGVWKTNGSGTFSDSTNMFAQYFPSQADKILKSVELTLFTRDNGLCNAVSSKITIRFNPAPEVSVASGQTVCKDIDKVQLSGTFKNAQGAFWQPVDGKGTFTPDNSQSITSYVLDPSDLSSTSVTLRYITYGSPSCEPVSATHTIKLLPTPVVEAGTTNGICSDAPSISLNGTVENAGGGTWSTPGLGSLVTSGQGLQATYIPTPADIAQGSVMFYLTSRNNNGCKAYRDSIIVPILPAPVIASVPSHTICADSSGVVLIPSVSGNINSVNWATSSGAGTFLPSATTQNVTFKPSSSQIASGKATVTLFARGGGVCANSQASFSTTINITPAPSLTLTDLSTCQGSTSVDLNAVQNNNIATAFRWTSLSTAPGTFTNPSALNTTYNTSAAEQAIMNGEVRILFETTAQGNCKPFKDTLTVRLVPTPDVNAGSDQTICTNVDSVRLEATGSVGKWSRIGTGTPGTFQPSEFALSASYFPSEDDKAANNVSLVFTSVPGGTCTPKSDTVDVTIKNGPVFNPVPDDPTCANTGPIEFKAQNSAGSIVTWYTEGSGIFSDTTGSVITYTPSAADIASENLTINVKLLDDARVCKPEFKKMNIAITPAPVVYSGSDFDVCGNAQIIPIAGNVTRASVGSGKWTVLSAGPGTFASTASSESVLLSDSYLPSAQEKQAKRALLLFTSNNNGTCKPVTDTLEIRFTDSPEVEAGTPGVPVCGDTAFVPLRGDIRIVNGGQWSHNGLGYFTDTNAVITNYVPNDDERTNGAKIKFVLTSYQSGTCLSEKDSLEIEIKPRPELNTGAEATVCGDTAFVALNGSVSNAGGGLWTVQAGSGSFNSTGTSTSALLTDRYIPSANDVRTGQVLLRLTTTGAGNCKTITDFKRITLTPTPGVDAGPDFDLCANNRMINLEASVLRVATGVIWSTDGNASFIGRTDSIITSYMPSAQDSVRKSVVFFLASTGNGACKPARDTLKVRFTPAPVVNVSPLERICADTNIVSLNGTVSGGATSGVWTTTGRGIFTDATSLNPLYGVTSTDKSNGNIIFTLTSDNNRNCNPVSKSVRLDIDPRPVVFAGNDTTVCSNQKVINLQGTSNAVVTAVRWSTTASPSFKTPVASLTTQYEPLESDVEKGDILFILETTAQGKCKPVKDAKVVSFQEAPVVTVNAGLPKTVCASNAVLELNGKVFNANRSVWSSLTADPVRRGTFEDSMKVNTLYQPSSFELGNGKDTSRVTLRLSASNTAGKCTSVATSEILITILPEPVIVFNAPEDTITVCADKDTIYVSAAATIAGKTVPGFWTSSGDGVFETNPFIPNPVYRLSEEDRKRGRIALLFRSDGNIGCDTVAKVKIVKLIPALPTADAGPDQEICKNNPVFDLDGRITVASVSGWHASQPVSQILPDSNSLSVTVIPAQANLEAGGLKMRLRTHGPATCKDVIDEMFVTFTESPEVVIPVAVNRICEDQDSVQLSASVRNAGSAAWTTDGTGTFVPSFTTVNAIYVPSRADKDKGSVKLKLTSTDIRNCLPVSDSIELNIRRAPVVSGSAETGCVSQTGVLLAGNSSTGSGMWTTDGSGSFSPNAYTPGAVYYPGFDDFSKGFVSLTFTSSNNETCRPVTAAVAINVSPRPVADAGKDQKICMGTSTQVAAISQANITRYSWFTLPDSTPVQENMVFNTGNLTNDMKYLLEVTDTKGCRNSDTVSVKMMPVPELEYSSPYCAMSLVKPVRLTADTIDGAFQWFRSGDLLASENRSSIIPEQKGTYLNVFSIYNCRVIAGTEVKPVPELDGLNKIICQNTSTTVEMTDVPKNNGYDWKFRIFGESAISSVANTTNKLDVNPGTDTLVYYVSVKDSSLCVSTDSVIVFPVPVPPVYTKLIDTTLCGGAGIVLDGTPVNYSNPRITYKWLSGETSPVKSVSAPVTTQVPDTANYILTLTLGECSATDTATIISNPNPAPLFPDTKVFCSDAEPSQPVSTVMLDAGSPGGTYKWNTGDTTQRIFVSQEGKYKVTVVNKYKCSASDSIQLIEQCEPRVFRPTAFTPNGDGKNDVFRVFGNKFVKNFKLMIFNRWGEVIFYMEDIQGDNVFESSNKVYSWDGTYRGDEMPMGSYPYIITYEGKQEAYKGPYQLTGSITLIR